MKAKGRSDKISHCLGVLFFATSFLYSIRLSFLVYRKIEIKKPWHRIWLDRSFLGKANNQYEDVYIFINNKVNLAVARPRRARNRCSGGYRRI